MTKEHIIGEWRDYENTRVVTLEDLKKAISDRNKYRWLHEEERTLRDYADKRKNLNFFHFEFCPMCGEKIDWKKIREME